MNTQLRIERYRRERRRGCWRWQKRGIESLIAWPAHLPRPHLRSNMVYESHRREGALGVTRASNYFIEPFTRQDAEQIFGPLVPGLGGETGPWFTLTSHDYENKH